MNAALLAEYGPALAGGLATTVLLSVAILAVATLAGTALALMRQSRLAVLAWPAAAYVSLFRVLPVLLVLFLMFYALPQLGIRLGPWLSAFAGLSLVGAAYMAEDIRGGLMAVDPGQVRAARALGLSPARTLGRIVAPQAVPIILAPYMTRAIIIVKSTSLASFVAVGDLTGEAVRATAITYEPFLFLTVAGLLYLALSGALAGLQAWLEARIARARRGPAPREAHA